MGLINENLKRREDETCRVIIVGMESGKIRGIGRTGRIAGVFIYLICCLCLALYMSRAL